LAALLFVQGGCQKDEKEKEPVAHVQVTPAAKSSISQIVEAEGVMFPLQQATVAPKITSTIAEFKVQRGSRVHKDEVLAILENRDLSAAAEASKGDFDQADANYKMTVNAGLPQQLQKAELDAAAAKSAFAAAEKVSNSRKDLFEQGAIPRRDLDASAVALAQARSQNEQAQKQLADLQRLGKEQLFRAARGGQESAEGRYRAAAAQLSYSEIRSPIDGVVTDRPLYVGDLATANQPMLTVMDTSRLIAKVHIPQSDAAVLKVGDRADLRVPAADLSVKAHVSLVSPALDPGSTTIEVWVEPNKLDSVLKPGMTVSLSMTAKPVANAVVVPSAAVFKNSDGADYVLLAGADNKAHQKLVRLGVHSSGLTQIAEGIAAGDSVITSGGYAVPEGTAIEVEKATAEDSKDKDNGKEKDAANAVDKKPGRSAASAAAPPKAKEQ
jgi:multidrug efflux pump subunit AcrA (membrane-fusion protein)